MTSHAHARAQIIDVVWSECVVDDGARSSSRARRFAALEAAGRGGPTPTARPTRANVNVNCGTEIRTPSPRSARRSSRATSARET